MERQLDSLRSPSPDGAGRGAAELHSVCIITDSPMLCSDLGVPPNHPIFNKKWKKLKPSSTIWPWKNSVCLTNFPMLCCDLGVHILTSKIDILPSKTQAIRKCQVWLDLRRKLHVFTIPPCYAPIFGIKLGPQKSQLLTKSEFECLLWSSVLFGMPFAST